MTVDDVPTAEEQRDSEFAEDKKVIVVDAETGEIKDEAGSNAQAATAEPQTSSHRKLV